PARTDPRFPRKRLGRSDGNQFDRHSARLSDLWTAYGRAPLRAHRQHRIGGIFSSIVRSNGLLCEQSWRRLAHQVVSYRVGTPWGGRKRYCPRILSYGTQSEAAGWNTTRRGNIAAHADGALRQGGGTCWGGDFSFVGRRQLCYWYQPGS